MRRAVFMPWWVDDNPYQLRLANGLLEHGWEVVPAPMSASRISALVRQRPAVVHLHWAQLRGQAGGNRLSVLLRIWRFLSGLRRIRRSGVRVVWTVHNLWAHEADRLPFDRLFRLKLARQVDQFIVHSHSAAEAVLAAYRVAPERVTVVPHANFIGDYPPGTVSQSDIRTRLGIADGEFVFLFFGQLRHYKGIPELIAAFRNVTQPGCRLVIAGPAPDHDLLAQVRRDAARDQRIVVDARFVPQDEVHACFAASDVVALPYRQILTSGAALLAMSMGKPCLAPDKGCLRELLQPVGGFLYPPDTPGALADALLQVIAQRAQLAAIGLRHYRSVEPWSWAAVARRTAEVYAQACSGTARAAGAAGAAGVAGVAAPG